MIPMLAFRRLEAIGFASQEAFGVATGGAPMLESAPLRALGETKSLTDLLLDVLLVGSGFVMIFI